MIMHQLMQLYLNRHLLFYFGSCQPDMSDAVEGGAGLAWRLLATLEGSSLVLAATALVAYSARKRLATRARNRRPIRTVLLTNSTTPLGRELQRQLEAQGCVVSTVTGDAPSGENNGRVDALVVVGAEQKADGLEGMAGVVTEDVYDNLKLLEVLSTRVRRDGCVAWACAGATSGATRPRDLFTHAGAAFDTVLQASLQHVAKEAHCDAIWVGRGDCVQRTSERLVAALIPRITTLDESRFSVRNAAHAVGEYLYRWLKIVT